MRVLPVRWSGGACRQCSGRSRAWYGAEGSAQHHPGRVKEVYDHSEEAKRFVELTKVDALAVAVGSMHKMKVKQAVLDIERIKSDPSGGFGSAGPPRCFRCPDEAVQAAMKPDQ